MFVLDIDAIRIYCSTAVSHVAVSFRVGISIGRGEGGGIDKDTTVSEHAR